MKKLKTIILSSIVMFLLGYILNTNSYATISYNINASASKNQVTYEERFTVNVRISNLETEKGLIALGATLKYDTDSLRLIDIEGQNRWADPMYSEASGKLTSSRSRVSTEDGDVFKITFEVKENAKDTAWIRVENFEVSNGSEEKNVGGTSLNIKISSDSTTNNSQNTDVSNNDVDNNQSENENQSGYSDNNNQGITSEQDETSGNSNQGESEKQAGTSKSENQGKNIGNEQDGTGRDTGNNKQVGNEGTTTVNLGNYNLPNGNVQNSGNDSQDNEQNENNDQSVENSQTENLENNSQEQTSNNSSNTNNNTSNENSKDTRGGKIPILGDHPFILVLIVIILLVAIVFGTKLLLLNKKMNKGRRYRK